MKVGRPKKESKYIQTAFKVPAELLAKMEEYIEQTTMNRSLFVRQAIIEYLENRNIDTKRKKIDPTKVNPMKFDGAWGEKDPTLSCKPIKKPDKIKH